MKTEIYRELVRELVNAWKEVRKQGGHSLLMDDVSSTWLNRAVASLEGESLADLQAGDLIDDGDDCVVYAASEALSGEGAGYWSNEDGWVGFESATRFARDEIEELMLPVSTDSDAKWISVGQALALVSVERKQAYVASGGTQCPSCQVGSPQGEEVVIDDGEAYQECSCSECGASWTDMYVLKGFTELNIPSSNE